LTLSIHLSLKIITQEFWMRGPILKELRESDMLLCNAQQFSRYFRTPRFQFLTLEKVLIKVVLCFSEFFSKITTEGLGNLRECKYRLTADSFC
jgi:hypothetical protein